MSYLNINFNNLSPLNLPTKVLVQDGIFDNDYYQELLGCFPTSSDMSREDVHNKIALNKYNKEEVNNFLNANEPWSKFIDYIFSDSFNKIINDFLNHKSSKYQSFNKHELNIGYEFSILRNGSRVVPHKDKYGKMISFVFYFVPNNWHKEFQYGGTQFYSPKNRLLNLKIFNDAAKFESMTLLHEVKPIANRLLIFEPNNTSWHGVYPIDTVDSIGRPAFIVTVHRKETLVEQLYNRIARYSSIVQSVIQKL
jgi:hypothetical protein